MNVQIDQLVKSLLEKDSLEQCSLEEVKEYADRHPFFGAAQLLLTKKMQTEQAEEYDEQLQKTFLFFHNPLWVKNLLEDNGRAEITVKEKKEIPPVEVPQAIQESMPDNIIAEEIITPTEPEIIELPGTSDENDSAEMPKFKFEPVQSSTSELLFEPYHAVDYFASQGIKFKEEEKPADKFGQQLKSFTAWLKTMKRLPAADKPETAEPVANKQVEQLAEHSIQDREIVTTTMAEVWEKQGYTAKAIEIYNNLSLLEHSKSPYFAAKIE
jgi:hypothetical protein